MSEDELIQKQIEQGNIPLGIDGDAYRFVFSALKREPNFKLSADFATKVSALTSSEKSFNWDKLLLIGGGVGFVAALIYAIISVKTSFSVGVFTFVSGYQGLIIFGAIFILLLNWLDKKLIRTTH